MGSDAGIGRHEEWERVYRTLNKKRTLLQRVCLAFMQWLGWRLHDDLPEEKKYVVIAAPHTSNWDFILGLPGMIAIGLPMRWIGKHTLFRGPLKWFFRDVLGGIPVDRRSKHGFVDQIVQRYEEADEMALVMSPEGTRRYTDHWKTGFWWIARKAGVPIVLGFIDWGRLEGGIGPTFWPGDDIEEDFRKLEAYYGDKRGLIPENESLIAIRD